MVNYKNFFVVSQTFQGNQSYFFRIYAAFYFVRKHPMLLIKFNLLVRSEKTLFSFLKKSIFAQPS